MQLCNILELYLDCAFPAIKTFDANRQLTPVNIECATIIENTLISFKRNNNNQLTKRSRDYHMTDV